MELRGGVPDESGEALSIGMGLLDGYRWVTERVVTYDTRAAANIASSVDRSG